MSKETVLAVLSGSHSQSWLESSLEDAVRLETVSQQALGRVLGLLTATGASIALVEVLEPDNASLALITAIANAKPWVAIVALCRVADQDTLLKCMRAGARDCVQVGSDGSELRDRLRYHQLAGQGQAGLVRPESRKLVLVTSVSPRTDSAFLAQSLALELAHQQQDQGILAIDIASLSGQVFHLDSTGSFDLGQLLSSSDTLDQNLINTALEEFRPGLRLLAGSTEADFLGDRGADLFIALSRLMGMFRLILLHVGSTHQSAWLKAVGQHVRDLVLVVNPEVSQLRQVEHSLAEWRPHLAAASRVHLLIDGFEPGLPPSLDDIAESTGEKVAAALPMEWRQRLDAINQGLPLQECVPKKNLYLKKLRAFVAALEAVEK